MDSHLNNFFHEREPWTLWFSALQWVKSSDEGVLIDMECGKTNSWDLEVGPKIKYLPDQQLKQLCLPENNGLGIRGRI